MGNRASGNGFFTFTRCLCSVLYIGKQEKMRKTRDFVLRVCFTDGREPTAMHYVSCDILGDVISSEDAGSIQRHPSPPPLPPCLSFQCFGNTDFTPPSFTVVKKGLKLFRLHRRRHPESFESGVRYIYLNGADELDPTPIKKKRHTRRKKVLEEYLLPKVHTCRMLLRYC